MKRHAGRHRSLTLGLALPLLLALMGNGAAQEAPPMPAPQAPPPAPAPSGAWLDATPVTAWNQQGAAVPRPPAMQGEPLTTGRCADQARPPETPADRSVVAAGWTLVGPLQVFGETSIVLGATTADGMCRPLGFQAFVFVRGRFAGTVSPQPMDARTDGSATTVRLVSRDRVMAEYLQGTRPRTRSVARRGSRARPSRIKRSPGGSVVLVESAQTEATKPD